jgi:hypothetical protein
MNADEDLLSALRARVADPETRRDSKTLAKPPLYPPATRETIAMAEAELGFPLHPFLRRLYTEVANGGFGPGYGLAGLTGGHGDSEGESLVARYREFRAGGWPEHLLPLWDWGCAAWSCLDANSAEGTIVTHDDVEGATVTDFTIRSWLRAWVDGVNLWEEIYEDKEAIVMNPFTRQPTVTKIRGRAKGKKN